jgi:hypothetical protein
MSDDATIPSRIPGNARHRRFRVWIVATTLLCVSLVVSRFDDIKLALARRWVERQSELAWNATFTERGIPIPERGPRHGRGRLIGTEDSVLGWRYRETHVPGLLDIDSEGRQHVSAGEGTRSRILIVGGSVAFGVFASSLETTYFSVMSRMLADAGRAVDVTVFASGAWKSTQEVEALRRALPEVAPDLVVILSGLNDLTLGSTAEVRYDPKDEPHSHDYPDRVELCLRNMREARDLVLERGNDIVFALQPALWEKQPLSETEQRITEGMVSFLGPRRLWPRAYQELRSGLAELSAVDGAHFVDASRAFDGESATTFVDCWHFGDAGQELLGRALSEALLSVLAGPPAEVPSLTR